MKKLCIACLLCAVPFMAQAQQVPGSVRVSTQSPPAAAEPAPEEAAAAAEDAEVTVAATGFVPLLGGLGALGGVAAVGVAAAALAGGGSTVSTTDTQ